MKSDCIFESYPVPVTNMLLDKAVETFRGFLCLVSQVLGQDI